MVHAHRRRAGEFVIQRHVQMSAPDTFAHKLANARLERLETLRHAQMQIEKAVIHRANGDAQAPAIFHGARLRVAGHGLQARGARLAGIDGDGF